MNNMAKNLLLWLLIAAVLLSVFNNFNLRSATEQVGYSEFIREVQTDRLSKVLVDGLTITAQRKDGSSFETIRPMVEDPKLMDDLLAHNVTVEGKQPEQQSVWTQLLIASFPILLIIAVFMFFMRQMQGGAGGRGGPMSFGKSKAKLLGEDQLQSCKVLVLANKQDLPTARSTAQVADAMGLTGHKRHDWFVQGCSAVKNEGLVEGLDWLCNALGQRQRQRRQAGN